jgi:hypothetical protein
MNPIPLPLKLRKNGFNYTQVKRGKKAFIYAQEVTKTVTYYEVFKIKVIPEKNIKGKHIKAHEKFPHDEAFGYWAWSYRDYNMAQKKFNELESINNK